MSQSASLTAALEAVERVLNAETTELKALAEIAGISPERLFLRADLSGIDLRRSDIEFLLPLQTYFEEAILTPRQRRAFRRSTREASRMRVRRQVQDLRTNLVTKFIEEYESSGVQLRSRDGEKLLTNSRLRAIILAPMLALYSKNEFLNANFTNAVIRDIEPWASLSHGGFFRKLFSLLGNLRCPVDKLTPLDFARYVTSYFRDEAGYLVGAFHATAELDIYWTCTLDPENRLSSAIQIGSMRPVHVAAIEKAINGLHTWKEILEILVKVPFECDSDEAERLALQLTRQEWQDADTSSILNAKTQYKVRNAIFRQLLAQGQERRVAEVIRWLDDNRGAAGALSLENAFVHIRDFNLALQLAQDIAPNLAENQMKVIVHALLQASYDPEHKHQVNRLRRFHLGDRKVRSGHPKDDRRNK